MTRTPEAGFGNTVYKTRRGAGAGARARWEGKKTAAFRRGGGGTTRPAGALVPSRHFGACVRVKDKSFLITL